MGRKSSSMAVLACTLALCACFVGVLSDTTTSTAAPETTTPAPSTSTSPAPETTTPTPATTTAAPTTLKPTTTPAPAPSTPVPPTPPSDGRGNWTVHDDNVTCIMAAMVVSVKVSYPLEAVNKTSTAEIAVPVSATASGSCDNSSQSIMIQWNSNSLTLNFGKNDTTKMYFINSIVLSVFADNKTFPNISSKDLNSTMTFDRKSLEFKTNFNQSYRCIREESLPLSKPNSTSNDAVLILNKVQLQAFHDKTPAVFGNAQDCELDTPDIVPIAVGCALAALVLVVLVAYLVGRRRSQARGYLSIFLD